MKKTIYLLFILLIGSLGQAQISISNGEHNIEISSRISTYYNQRFLKPGEEERDKNRFRLRDAQLIIEGRIRDDWEYEVQVDFADIGSNNTGEIDAENPGLMDAFVTYKGLEAFNIKLGYSKLPYSRSSITPFPYSTYWQRAQIVRGDFFSRRDVGVTLYKDFWQKRVNAFAGVYTGLGESSLSGDNDASGNPEFVARVDVSYPAPMKNREIDYVHSSIPLFSLGLNGRYTNKNLPDGEAFPDGAAGEYGLKIVDGKKYTYGMDFTFQYKGFSGQFEIHQINAQPQNENDPLFLGLTPAQTEGRVLAGGYFSQLNYFVKDYNTIVSVRYEQLDLNDLNAGDSKRMSAAIAYQIDGFDAMVKLQYFNNLNDQESLDPLDWNQQIRLGLQFNL
ncbi:phosphate-selective porin O/P [Nonlabens xylanidelens]|uniref:Phosphate-selective porin O/P n=1 Tax=Nonlabens xylanidelens TaxID=191564 RepID=A0A2S6IN16_9FLAO|nr:porin [Nonlabens xylanidelens]PPK95608.1 phosphate-selective porin O/P [Nonlabens xylanidelens]PQJ22411.1 hypothetical protein BST94_02235 [Nonlabens xylanidelens]